MKENKYDDAEFFGLYAKMSRSVKGLAGAGEWHILKSLLPDIKDKRVLDLGCGYGWHCRYAIENGAHSVIGVDISEKMLGEAKQINNLPGIEYKQQAIEDLDLEPNSVDLVISSLAFHYIESFEKIVTQIHEWLCPGGWLVFSVEHPVFTAYGSQDWHYDRFGNKLHWPVDSYFEEGKRKAVFLGKEITKYHKTLTTYMDGLLLTGFTIKRIVEPQPEEHLVFEVPDMKDELRRPMMLIVSATRI